MARERNNTEGLWDEFRDFCEDNNIRLGEHHEHIWGVYWQCWLSAIEAREAKYKHEHGAT